MIRCINAAHPSGALNCVLHNKKLNGEWSIESFGPDSKQPKADPKGEGQDAQSRVAVPPPLRIHQGNSEQNILSFSGELAEWSKAAVLKTVDGQPSGGSNPSLSAIKQKKGLYGPFLFYREWIESPEKGV